jgi:hypothetical protein
MKAKEDLEKIKVTRSRLKGCTHPIGTGFLGAPLHDYAIETDEGINV